MKQILHTKAIIKSTDTREDGVIEGIIGSSSVVDRMGDIIEQDGWDLENYLANPVILWGHNVREEKMPIGKALKVWVEGKGKRAKLMFDVKFDLQDSFAAEVYRKIKDGFINAVSVGFMPTEYEELDPGNWWGGLKYLKQELFELSVVPVPANPKALIPMKALAQKDARFTPVEEKDLFPQVEDNRFKRLVKESKQLTIEQVKEIKDTEYVSELRSIEDFEEDSFVAVKMTKDDKECIAIIGQLKEQSVMVEQSFRYAKSLWSEEDFKKAEAITKSIPTMDEEGTVTDPDNEDKAKEEDEVSSYTDDTELPNVTALQLRNMMDEVWKNGYKAGDESDDKSVKAMDKPEDDMKVKGMKVGQYKALMDDCFSDKKPMEDKATSENTIKEIVEETITKSGRVLSSKNEKKVRQALELLSDVLKELDKEDIEEEPTESKNVVPFKAFGTAPDAETWDIQGEVNKSTVTDLAEMSAWYDKDKSENKDSYKLIHHKAGNDHRAVWRGVASAMASLLGAKNDSEIPEADRKGIYDHLVKHYEEFGKQAPSFEMVENQVLAGLSEELQALVLDREDKHMVRLLKKVLENQKEDKKLKETKPVTIDTATEEDKVKALQLINDVFAQVVPKLKS